VTDKRAKDASVDLEPLLRELVSAAQLFQSAAGLRARLTPTELAVLALLRSNPRVAGQLAAATQLTTGAITRVLDGLERRGFVTRLPDPGDRRRVIVSAVAERVAALDTLFGPMTDAAAAVQSTFSEADQRTIARFLTATTEALRAQTAELRTGETAASGPVTLGAPVGSAPRGRLHLAGGLRHLAILGGGADFPPDLLYQGSFSGVAPTSEVATRPDESEVRIRFGRKGALWAARPGCRASTLTLNPRLSWAIEVRGGAEDLAVDTTSLALSSFSLTGGANDLRLRLGPPAEPARISLTGGAKRLHLERPKGVPVDLVLRGGASHVVIDGERHGPFGNWSSARGGGGGRYELALTGGVSHLEIAPLR
jgi:DNA-binding MarR family transcriptional regulator